MIFYLTRINIAKMNVEASVIPLDFKCHHERNKFMYWGNLYVKDLQTIGKSHFTEAPTYQVWPWKSLVKIERRARQAGFELILRTTVNNELSPTHLDTDYLQRTQWFFGIPGKALVIHVTYTEALYKKRDALEGPKAYTECEVIGTSIREHIPPNYSRNGGCYSYECDQTGLLFTGHVDSMLNPLRNAYPKSFWTWWSENSLTGVIQDTFITELWSMKSVCPGFQTNTQHAIGHIVDMAFINQVLKSPLKNYFRSVETWPELKYGDHSRRRCVPIFEGRTSKNTWESIMNIKNDGCIYVCYCDITKYQEVRLSLYTNYLLEPFINGSWKKF